MTATMLTPGTRLGPYEIIGPLGAGGMGEVYRARDTRLDRVVAIKVLPQALAADAQFRARFDREARAISQLTHPHICTLYDVGNEGGTAFLVMELLQGQMLADRLQNGSLPLGEALQIAIAVADALSTAHRQGIIHRDLKPGNIMLTKAGAKLLDFGLAKSAAPVMTVSASSTQVTAPLHLTERGMMLGTLHYMAPEQVEGGDADARSDIWALGAVIYEMVSGQLAFSGDSSAGVVGAILKDRPLPLSVRRQDVPLPLDHLVGRCLEKDTEDRWQTAGDVRRELQWIASGPTAGAVVGHDPRRTKPWGLWLTLASALTALVTGVGWWQSVRRVDRSPASMTLALAPPETIRITGATALSPDGRAFVFVGQGDDGPPALWIRSIDTGAARRLSDTDDPAFPFWSPGGDAIGFFASGKLKTIAAAGGPAKALTSAASAARGGSWGADGTILYVPETNSPIFRIADRGGESSAVTRVDATRGEIGHRWPVYVDAEHFLFTVQSTQRDKTGIYLGTYGAERMSRLVPQYSNSVYSRGHLLYVNEGAIVARPLDLTTGALVGQSVELVSSVAFTGGLGFTAFSASPALLAYPPGTALTATTAMKWFDRSGTLLGRLGEGSDLSNYNAYYQQVSPDGRKVVLSAFPSTTADLWLVDTERQVSSRFTFDGATEFSPVWSPDGTELLYASNRDGYYNIYRQAVSKAGGGRRLAESNSHQYPTDWSADGHTLVFTNIDSKTQADIWTMSVDGGSQRPVLTSGFNEFAGRLSPDGQWLAYASDESGRAEVYLQRFPAGTDKVQLSTQGGSHPQWRVDGTELFYLAADRKITAVAITLSPVFMAARPARLFDVPVDTSTGSMHAYHFAASGDGQRFLLGVSTLNQTSTGVLVNWRQSLKTQN